MSGVVMRCQNCGTTQAALGECEACHEGEVRHFCPNHSPGRWLDEAACTVCGARVGVPGRTERVAPRRPPVSPPIPRERSVPVRPPTRRPPPLEEVELEPEVWSGPIHEPRVGRSVLEELLRAGMRGGSPIVPSMPDIGMTVASGFGCLRRLVMVAFLLMMLAVAFFFGLLGFSPPARYREVAPDSNRSQSSLHRAACAESPCEVRPVRRANVAAHWSSPRVPSR